MAAIHNLWIIPCVVFCLPLSQRGRRHLPCPGGQSHTNLAPPPQKWVGTTVSIKDRTSCSVVGETVRETDAPCLRQAADSAAKNRYALPARALPVGEPPGLPLATYLEETEDALWTHIHPEGWVGSSPGQLTPGSQRHNQRIMAGFLADPVAEHSSTGRALG